MKLALDPQMFFATSSVFELPDVAASLGYAWIELSPKDDFIPFFRHPRIDDAGVRRLKKVAADAGVGIAGPVADVDVAAVGDEGAGPRGPPVRRGRSRRAAL